MTVGGLADGRGAAGARRIRRRLIVGLGNPGPRYDGTRHNLGFAVLDRLAAELSASFRARDRALVAQARHGGLDLVLVKPQTYMNESGRAVVPLMRRHGLAAADLLVVHDDLDLAVGVVRLRRGGGPGGHRGVESIIVSLGDREFPRLKLGIGRPPVGLDPTVYVLQRPAPAGREPLAAAVAHAVPACLTWARDGLATAMNQHNYNPRPPSGPAPEPDPAAPAGVGPAPR